MSTITRSWLAFAAIGAGLIHVALVIGSPLPLGIVLAVLGLTEFGWGVLTFARESIALPRVALVVALLPVLAWGLLLVTSSVAEMPAIAASFAFLPLGVASLFGLFAASVLGMHLRRVTTDDTAPRAPGIARYLLGIVAGGLIVATLTTPALAATEAGTAAQPHGEVEPYELILPGHETGH